MENKLKIFFVSFSLVPRAPPHDFSRKIAAFLLLHRMWVGLVSRMRNMRAHTTTGCALFVYRGGTKVKTTSRGRATGKDGAVFGGGSVQETVQGTDETHGAQVSRQELLQTQL